MGLVDKLKAAQGGGGGKRLQLKPDGEFKMGARIHFLQELDEDKVDPKYGQAEAVDVHTLPGNFKVQAACSFPTEGKCLACERAARGGDDDWMWRAKTHLLVNVLVKAEDKEPVVKVLDKTMGKNDIGVQILEYNEEYGSITDRDYRYKRTGTGRNDTKYTLTPLEEIPNKFDGELLDLTTLYTVVPYADQEAFYGEGSSDESSGWD